MWVFFWHSAEYEPFEKKFQLEKLLKSTPKRTLANYLIFYYMDHAMNGLSVHDNVIKKRNCEKV